MFTYKHNTSNNDYDIFDPSGDYIATTITESAAKYICQGLNLAYQATKQLVDFSKFFAEL